MMYIFLLIVVLAVAYYVTNKNPNFFKDLSGMTTAQNYGQPGGQASGAPPKDRMKELSEEMGFTYTKKQSSGAKNEVYSMGGRMSGEYNGARVDIIMESDAHTEKHWDLSVQYAYSYKTDSRVVMHVKNPDGKKFEITPKSAHVTAKPTGNARFDENLQLTGDQDAVSDDLLNYAAELGWMDMRLSGTTLTFTDSFYEQPRFTEISATAATEMLKTVHPVWGTTPQNQNVTVERLQRLLKVMYSTAEPLL